MSIGKFSAFCLVALALCLAAASFFALGNIAGSIVFSGLLLIFIGATRGIWQGPRADEWSYRKFAFRSVIVIGTSQTVWLIPDAKPHFAAALSRLGLSVPATVVDNAYFRPISIFTFIAVCLFILGRPPIRTAMRRHPVALQSDFRSVQEQQQLQTYCRSLQTRIRILNDETSWTEEYFTPLDAQVEFGSGRSLVSKVEDL